MSLDSWQAAWQRYAIAAAITGQFPVEAAMRHREEVLAVAFSAAGRTRSPLLGVFYDDLARYSRL